MPRNVVGILELELASDVAKVAADQGVDAWVPPVYDMTQRLFPRARRVDIVAESDPEIANDCHLVFVVHVGKEDIDDAAEARWKWCREIFDHCPAPQACVFRVAISLVQS